MKNILIVTCTFLFILFVWEFFSYFNPNLIWVLPPPSQIFNQLIEKPDCFLFHTGVTLKEILGGFALAFSVAFPLAWVMDHFSIARNFLQPFFVIIQCIPMFTLAPIMIMWFGWSYIAIAIPTALMIFFPLTITLFQGLRSVPKELTDYFMINHATHWQIFCKLKLPWSLPHLFSGLRLSAAIAGIAAIAGEWAGAQNGLGVLMVESRRDMDLATNFAALFCLTLLSYLIYSIILLIEYFILKKRFFKTLKTHFTYSRLTYSIVFVFFVGCGILMGCHRQASSKPPVRLVLDWLPNPNHIPFYVGIHKGFFQEHHINISIKKMQEPGHATSYLLLDQCELALAYMPHTIRVEQKKGEVEPIGILIQEPLNALIVREEGEIHDLTDLNGKMLGFCTGGKEAATLNKLLANASIAVKGCLNVNCDLITPLRTKNVDVIYGAYWNIETEHLKSLGIRTRNFKLTELGMPTYYELIVLAKTKTIYTEEEFVQLFKKGLQKSINYSRLHPNEAFEIYALYQQNKSIQTLTWENEAWKKTIPVLAEQQEISPMIWNTFQEWLRINQLL
ncbi:ABC transporter substrate-binding protein [Candidatus Protochlamydia amoebophila]|uniref:ABC transporter substrate-binding protein n=1 Tax=Candidatus Protochlamydia amoebophila TaxID=362787 RepID=UPI001BC9AD85|nr:ABC transporter substrate-binding protein [Candidatus Protochlamydia amoebophila]